MARKLDHTVDSQRRSGRAGFVANGLVCAEASNQSGWRCFRMEGREVSETCSRYPWTRDGGLHGSTHRSIHSIREANLT
jgi:hypothetical protein